MKQASAVSLHSGRRTGRGGPLILLTCLVLAAVGCAQTPDTALEQRLTEFPPSGVKVLLVGIDGATFKVIQPMISQGRLPVLARMIETGAHGSMKSEKPMISPALWTTVVTGQKRKIHGIVNFLRAGQAGDDARLFTSADRHSLALWNLMGPFGRTVGFAGWWTSWPAEPVDGWILSDRMVRTRWSEWADGPQEMAATHPAELAEELRDLVVDPLDPPVEELRALADFTESEFQEMLAARKPILGHGPSVLKFAWSAQRSYEKMILAMVERSQPDLLGVFLIATDPVSHTFWHDFEPSRFAGVNRDEAMRLGGLISNVYTHDDRFLGNLLDRLAPDTVTLVISDHGFRASGKLPRLRSAAGQGAPPDPPEDVVAVGQPGRHGRKGILIAAGGPIRRGAEVEATLVDVAPTILTLLGMPVPEDMPGRVLDEILEPQFLADYPVRRIPTYADLVARPALELPENLDDPEAMEMLRSLGYVQ